MLDGILYLFFSAIPIIFEESRGWGSVVGILPFLAVLVRLYRHAISLFSYLADLP